MSAMACIVERSFSTVFDRMIVVSTCPDQLSPAQLQAITFLDLGGLLSMAKEVMERNKSNLEK